MFPNGESAYQMHKCQIGGTWKSRTICVLVRRAPGNILRFLRSQKEAVAVSSPTPGAAFDIRAVCKGLDDFSDWRIDGPTSKGGRLLGIANAQLVSRGSVEAPAFRGGACSL